MISKSELYFNSMEYSQIHLNDFETFNNFLFSVGERDWSTFLDGDGYFIPPITKPVSIVQHQLCHYALWMTIAKNDLRQKPCILHGVSVPSLCYACKYGSSFAPDAKLCSFCPLERDTAYHNCGREFSSYQDCALEGLKEASEWAEKVAKMIWREKTESSSSQRVQFTKVTSQRVRFTKVTSQTALRAYILGASLSTSQRVRFTHPLTHMRPSLREDRFTNALSERLP